MIIMPSYTVTVATGSQWFAGTDDYIYITLVGTERCSERTLLDKPLYNDFERGAVSDAPLFSRCKQASECQLHILYGNIITSIYDRNNGCIEIKEEEDNDRAVT